MNWTLRTIGTQSGHCNDNTESESSFIMTIIIVGCLRVHDPFIASILFKVYSRTALFNGKTEQNEYLWHLSSAETDKAYKPLGRGSMDTVLSKIVSSLTPELEHHGRGYEPRRHKSETLCGTGTKHPPPGETHSQHAAFRTAPQRFGTIIVHYRQISQLSELPALQLAWLLLNFESL